MGKSIKSFKQFASYANRRKPEEPEKEFEMPKKGKKLEPMVNDLDPIQKEIENQIEKAKGEWEIVSVMDVSTEEPSLSEQQLSEAVIINADLGSKEIKRNDEIYITAMLKKKKADWTSPTVMGVIKVRVIDIYQGLYILNTLKK